MVADAVNSAKEMATKTMNAMKMSVIFYCVTAIVGIQFLYLHYDKEIGYGGITAMTFITALGGVDVIKQWKSPTGAKNAN